MREYPVEKMLEDVMSLAERAHVAFARAAIGVPFGVVEIADQRRPVASLEPASAVA